MIAGALDLPHAGPTHFSNLPKVKSTHNPLGNHKVPLAVGHDVTRVPVWYARQSHHPLEVLQQAVFGDWFDPIHAEDVIFSVAVTDGCLPTLEILSIAAGEDPAVAYLTGPVRMLIRASSLFPSLVPVLLSLHVTPISAAVAHSPSVRCWQQSTHSAARVCAVLVLPS